MMSDSVPSAEHTSAGRPGGIVLSSGKGEPRTPAEIAIKGARTLRTMLFLHRKGVKFGRLPYIWGTLPRLVVRGTCRVGARFRLDGVQFQADLQVGPDGHLEVGDDVFINRGVTIYASTRVTIGNNVRVADLASIHDSDLHEVEPGRPVTEKAIAIGDNAWIGRGAVVLPGIEIGEHAVIGAGSVVTRSVPPWSLAAGNPAKVVRALSQREGWVRH